MNNFIRICLTFLFAGILNLPFVNGQAADTTGPATVNAVLLETSSMSVAGSSTLHDWEVEATDFSVQFQIPVSWFISIEGRAGDDVSELKVTVPVEHLDGGKNKMNRDLRDALSYPDHENIQFIWDEISFTGVTDTGRKAEVSGRLLIAGVERYVTFNADLGLNEWSQIVVSGSVRINMRDYNVEPPKVLFGVIRTDEIVNLSFELFFGRDE